MWKLASELTIGIMCRPRKGPPGIALVVIAGRAERNLGYAAKPRIAQKKTADSVFYELIQSLCPECKLD